MCTTALVFINSYFFFIFIYKYLGVFSLLNFWMASWRQAKHDESFSEFEASVLDIVSKVKDGLGQEDTLLLTDGQREEVLDN